MSEPISAGLIAHEISHCLENYISSKGDNEMQIVTVGKDVCVTLDQGADTSILGYAIGGIFESLVISKTREALLRGLLQHPREVGEILIANIAKDDWSHIEDKAETPEFAAAVRQAGLIYWALDSQSALTESAQAIADRIGDGIGVMRFDVAPMGEFVTALFEAAESTAALPDVLWCTAEFCTDRMGVFDFDLQRDDGQGFDSLVGFTPTEAVERAMGARL